MIVAGFGFTSSASAASLHDALDRAAAPHGGAKAVALLATAADKADRLAAAFARPVRGLDPEAIAAQTPATRSPASQAARGTGSLAEAAALAAAGPGARLLGPRVISADRKATCALARGDGA